MDLYKLHTCMYNYHIDLYTLYGYYITIVTLKVKSN